MHDGEGTRKRSPQLIPMSIKDDFDVIEEPPPPGPSSMSLRGALLRLSLMSTLFGILWAGRWLDWRQDNYAEDHPVGMFFSGLNLMLKRAGWLLTAFCWAGLLIARYNRQVNLQENASWRRHAVVDSIIWVIGSVYWASVVYFVLKRVAEAFGECIIASSSKVISASKTATECLHINGKWVPLDISGHTFLCSMAIGILLEEVIRFIGEPVYYFTFHSTDAKIERAKLYWRVAVIGSLILSLAWLVLFIRTALFYHTFQEKVWGTLMGTGFWWIVVLVRFITL